MCTVAPELWQQTALTATDSSAVTVYLYQRTPAITNKNRFQAFRNCLLVVTFFGVFSHVLTVLGPTYSGLNLSVTSAEGKIDEIHSRLQRVDHTKQSGLPALGLVG